ncbi:MAG: hypothetical protein HOP33_21680 [Verrucomicrobia bacterium]|nr:hypothetical protein [Verrucomicrobiota bacterium]
MKTTKSTWLKLLFLCATLAAVIPAYAFYSPAQQRWLNRDPLGDLGFAAATRRNDDSKPRSIFLRQQPELSQDPNLFAYVRNSPVNDSDPYGLASLFAVYCWPTGVTFTSCTFTCYLKELFHIPFTGPTTTTSGKNPGITIPSLCGILPPCLPFGFVWIFP